MASEEETAIKSGLLLRRLRERREWTRGQAARRLKVSPAILYNMETGRSRAPLGFFFDLLAACKHEPATTLGRFLFSVKELTEVSGASLVKGFRARLKLTQREMARRLGYKSAAMIHHFEKGLREPALDDLLALMALAEDDARGFVLHLSGDEALATLYPAGMAAARRDWAEYWQLPQAAAVRQLMRTTKYERESTFVPGVFAEALGVPPAVEEEALDVLTGLGVVTHESGRPMVDPKSHIVIPRHVPRAVIDGFKASWVDFMRARYLAASGGDDTLCSIDLIPVNRALYGTIVEKIRTLQDEIHNLPLTRTDGFACLGWLGSYVTFP